MLAMPNFGQRQDSQRHNDRQPSQREAYWRELQAAETALWLDPVWNNVPGIERVRQETASSEARNPTP